MKAKKVDLKTRNSEIKKLYVKGEDVLKIAKKFRMSVSNVYKICK